ARRLAAPHRPGGCVPAELALEHTGELARAADDERPPVLRRGLQLLDQSAEYRETDGQAHQRRRVERAARPRAWIASRTPTAARFAIIDEPPTLTNGSGMPVIGAIPIVIPTLTKIWKSSATTMPPATTAEYKSRAVATIRRPRQSTSR